MLTVKKLNNLLMYFVLFKTCEDINTFGTLPHYTYIVEKYDSFFNDPPDIDNKFMDLHWGNKDVWNKGTEYIVKWGQDTNEFLNIPEYSRWLFTHYLVHSTEEANKIKIKHNYQIEPEELRIRRLIMIYNKFFSSYDPISEESLEHLLHAKLKDFYKKIFDTHKMIFRNVFINQQTKK